MLAEVEWQSGSFAGLPGEVQGREYSSSETVSVLKSFVSVCNGSSQ